MISTRTPDDGEVALTMVLTLLADLGQRGAVDRKVLDGIIQVGCDTIGRDRGQAHRIKRLKSYRAAWRQRRP